MGFSDRDYMKERSGSGSKVVHFRPAAKPTPTYEMALYLLAALYLLYKGALWWQDHQLDARMREQQTAPARSEPTAAPTVAAPAALRALPTARTNSDAEQPNLPPVQGSVNKCLINGRVIYSDGSCPQGASVEALKLQTYPKGETPRVVREAAAVSVQQPEPAAVQQPTLHTPSQAAPVKAAECGYLDEAIKQIDIEALKPQSLQRQDWLRAERKKARDKQFFLGC
jgi:hypothetical protein